MILHDFLDNLYTTNDWVNVTCLHELKPNVKPISYFEKTKNLKILITKDFIEAKAKQGFNICITPNTLKTGENRSAKNIKTLNTFYVDIDNSELDINKITPTPHYVFKRTDTHYHLYWLLDSVSATKKNKENYLKIAENLIEQCNGDKAVKDISRILRLPYTWHIKEKPFTQYKKVFENLSTPRYSFEDFENASDKETALNSMDTPELVLDYLEKIHKERQIIQAGDGRSLFLFHLGLDCYSYGLEEKTALDLALQINEIKCTPPETVEKVTHQIKCAYKYHKGSFGEYVEILSEAGTDTQRKKHFNQFKEFVRIRDKLKNWLYVSRPERMIDLKTGLEFTTKNQIQNHINQYCSTLITFNTILARQLIRVVDDFDFRPDLDTRIYEQNKLKYYNRFRPLKLETVDLATKEAKKNIKFFTEHIKYLTNTERECEMVLNFLAYKVQNLGEKLPYALLVISEYQGIGKSLLEKLFRNIYQDYIYSIENSQITSGWTHYMADKLFVFVHELAQGDKYNVANRFKNMITESTIEINGKYARSYTARNTVNFIMFSNEPDAIHISSKDRRFLVIQTNVEPRKAQYYDDLVSLFDNEYMTLYSFLLDRDLTNFNPHERPDATEGKIELIEQGKSEIDLLLTDWQDEKEHVFNKPIIDITQLQTCLQIHGSNLIKNKISLKALMKWLKQNEYKKYEISKSINKIRIHKRVWSKIDPVKIKDLDVILNDLLSLEHIENSPEKDDIFV